MKNLEIVYLMDFYGNLLKDKQREIMQLYYQEDLSLSEISAEYNMTRQGVRDNLVRAERELINYESTLGLCKRFSAINVSLAKIKELISPDTVLSQKNYIKIIDLINSVENDM